MPKIRIKSWQCDGGGAPYYLLLQRWTSVFDDYFAFYSPKCSANHTDTHEKYFDAYVERREKRCMTLR